jgi:hypothetical protein
MITKQPDRNYLKEVKETIEEAGYSSKNLKRALNQLHFSEFPEGGITDNGLQKILNIVKEIDNKESNLEGIVEVSSKPKKIKKNKKSNTYLSVVGKDLGKVGKGIGESILFVTGWPLILPSMSRIYNNKATYSGVNAMGLTSGQVYAAAGAAWGYAYGFMSNPKLASILLGIQLGTNALSGLYEWYRKINKELNLETKFINNLTD